MLAAVSAITREPTGQASACGQLLLGSRGPYQSLVWGVSQVVYYGSRNQEFKIRGLRADGAGAMDATDSGLEMSVADR